MAEQDVRCDLDSLDFDVRQLLARTERLEQELEVAKRAVRMAQLVAAEVAIARDTAEEFLDELHQRVALSLNPRASLVALSVGSRRGRGVSAGGCGYRWLPRLEPYRGLLMMRAVLTGAALTLTVWGLCF